MYLDVDSSPHFGFDEYGTLFRWPFVSVGAKGDGICNCMFGFEQGSSFLRFAMEVVRDVCKVMDYCKAPYGTGPNMFTHAFMQHNQSDVVLIESSCVSRNKIGCSEM